MDQTDILLEYSVLAKLNIPQHYDQVGQGGAALPLQGVAGVCLLPGEGLGEETAVTVKQYKSQSCI